MNKKHINSSVMVALTPVLLLGHPNSVLADTTLSVESVADTYLNSGSIYANRDLSNYGAMEISANLPNPAQGINDPRTMDLLVAYDTATIKAGFDTQYGVGNWHVTSAQVKWYSNYDIIGTQANNIQFNGPAAGSFNISLLTNNTWFNAATAAGPGLANTDVNWNSVFITGGAYSTLLDGMQTLGTYAYTGGDFNGGNNCLNEVCDPRFWNLGSNTSLINIITNGGYISLFGSAADGNVSYIVSQRGAAGAHPQLFISADAGATAVPIPAAVWLWLSSCISILGLLKRRN